MSRHDDQLLAPARRWFARSGWTPFAFQEQAWIAGLSGRSGLVHAPTGTGKTLAVALGPMLRALADGALLPNKRASLPLQIVWLTPLKALAADTAMALEHAVEGLGLKWNVELRTGDSSASARMRHRAGKLPQVLVTTPESLSLLISYPELTNEQTCTPPPLASLKAVIVDEWHELIGTKRGVQVELALATLRAINPGLLTWGVSATLGNLDEAARVLVGPNTRTLLVTSNQSRFFDITTIIPSDVERFPWAGHLGIRMLPQVCEAIDSARTSLLFTNTRSQAEIWFAQLLLHRPEYLGLVALHHGSLDKGIRARVEHAVKSGQLRCVVCTSSLDLGVDFAPVDQVIQVGSPKGLARFIQRAGRSGHQPGGTSKVVCVPTNALELVEFAAAIKSVRSAGEHMLESREPLRLCLDVLVQHMLTVAAGAGFDPETLKSQVRSTHAYADLSETQWAWAFQYAKSGGPALAAYEHFARLEPDRSRPGRWVLRRQELVRNHRLNIGTITAELSMIVRIRGGRVLGTIEESYVSRLSPGDMFWFAGRSLELVAVRDTTAFVKPSKRRKGRAPSWAGSRMPISTQLANALQQQLLEVERGGVLGVEMKAVAPILDVQRAWSALPLPGTLLIEHLRTAEGFNAFVYPLQGRLVHEGLAALVAWRLASRSPRTISIAANDYGFHLCSSQAFCLNAQDWKSLLSQENLLIDLRQCLNASELAKRQFRDIARIAGLLTPSFPGRPRPSRHLQATSALFYEVFKEHEPDNLLLDQADRQVFQSQFESTRMEKALETIARASIVLKEPRALTPFAFPLWVDSLREQLTTEKLNDRIARMLTRLESDLASSSSSVCAPMP